MNKLPLPLRNLGNSGLSLSAAGLGTVKFGRNQAMKYPEAYALPDAKRMENLLAIACDYGINWLDTAPAYGLSEERLGALPASQHFLICTKVGEEFARGTSYFNFTAAHTQASIERSLQRLRRETLDIVLIHSDGNDLDIIEHSDCLTTLTKAKEAGKIRAIGMSTKTLAGALRALPLVDVLMLTRNPQYEEDTPAILKAKEQGVGTIIKKGFGSGHLFASTPIDTLCDFLFSAPITSVVTGTLNPEHLISNCEAIAKAANAHPL